MRYKGTYEGNSLRHYRTKGSRNGISKNPDYKPIGKLAKGPKYYDSRRDDPDWEQDLETNEWRLTKPANDRLWKESFAETGNMYKNVGKKVGEGLLNVFTKGAYGRSKKIGKLIAEKAVNSDNSDNAKAVPVYIPNNKSSAQKSNMKAAEERRISGGNTGMTRSVNAKPLLSGTQAVGMKGVGAYNAYAAKKKYEETRRANQQAAEQRRISGGSAGTSFDPKKQAEQRRIKGGSQGTSFDRQKAAEARRIAGSKLGSGYVDSGAGNFRRGVKLAGQAIKERMNPNHKQRSMNKHYGEVINETVSKYHAKQAAKEIGTGVKKGANYAVNEGKKLVKKGKKKVKSLMKRFFN